MRTNVLEIPHTKYESQRNLGLDMGFREVVADYLRRRWPTGTAKMAARAFDLTLDRAREAVAGRTSLTTLEQIFKRGGFAVALPIVAAVIGQSLANYFLELRRSHEDHGKRIAALFSDTWSSRDPGSGGDSGGDRLGRDRGEPAHRRVG